MDRLFHAVLLLRELAPLPRLSLSGWEDKKYNNDEYRRRSVDGRLLINKLDGSKIDNKGCYPLGTTQG